MYSPLVNYSFCGLQFFAYCTRVAHTAFLRGNAVTPDYSYTCLQHVYVVPCFARRNRRYALPISWTITMPVCIPRTRLHAPATADAFFPVGRPAITADGTATSTRAVLRSYRSCMPAADYLPYTQVGYQHTFCWVDYSG